MALAWAARQGTRLHASFGTGIRPPGGFELAFTNNPALRPERTASFDAGIEQRLFANRLAVEATYFYNRFTDLIVSLGGSLARLSSYRSDNLANSRAQGAEFTARWQAEPRAFGPRQLYAAENGDPFARRLERPGAGLFPRRAAAAAPAGALRARWWAACVRGRVSANLTGYFRGDVLDVEPNYGASAGLFRNPGYVNMGVNLNYRVAPGVTVYGHLRNALDRRYEEVYGYPAPLLNFVAGMKFALPGAARWRSLSIHPAWLSTAFTRAAAMPARRAWPGGQRVAKDSRRIEAYGTVDELNAFVGVAGVTAAELPALATSILRRVQHELFNLGSLLATLPEDLHPRQARVTDADVERLEAEIDRMNEPRSSRCVRSCCRAARA